MPSHEKSIIKKIKIKKEHTNKKYMWRLDQNPYVNKTDT